MRCCGCSIIASPPAKVRLLFVALACVCLCVLCGLACWGSVMYTTSGAYSLSLSLSLYVVHIHGVCAPIAMNLPQAFTQHIALSDEMDLSLGQSGEDDHIVLLEKDYADNRGDLGAMVRAQSSIHTDVSLGWVGSSLVVLVVLVVDCV